MGSRVIGTQLWCDLANWSLDATLSHEIQSDDLARIGARALERIGDDENRILFIRVNGLRGTALAMTRLRRPVLRSSLLRREEASVGRSVAKNQCAPGIALHKPSRTWDRIA